LPLAQRFRGALGKRKEGTLFSASDLDIDPVLAIGKIERALRQQVLGQLRRRGIVLGLSGGIDSSVVAALAARAVGPERVLALLMPEQHSDPDSLRLGRAMADQLGIEAIVEDVSGPLDALGCYSRQEEAIRQIFPEYGPGWRSKVTLPSILEVDRISVSRLTVRDPSGEERSARMTAESYRQLVAATNFKQRVRKMLEYYHADRLGYAVAGTPNRLEYDQGFFVKQGDGAADVKPIAHLYKTQVYALAAELGVISEIRERPPTTDTFSLEQTQEEFYFSLPYHQMDLCLYALDHGVSAEEAARVVDLRPDQIERVFADILRKRQTTSYLHMPPLFVEHEG
jgi:NAD+ synthase